MRIMENSHSTMYLLKRENNKAVEHSDTFTFHHVSIKTMCMVSDKLAGKTFTFHHVSIKTPYRFAD